MSLNGTVVDGKLVWKECAKRDLPDRKMDYIFSYDLTEDRIRSFLNSAGIISNGDVRNFMLMSLSAPALLDYGERNGVVGLHLKQTYEQHDSVKLGPLEVGVCAGKSRPGIAIFENYWIQNGRLVASGKSMVGPATIYPEEIKFAA